jgi:hypothetical protein
LAFRVCDVDACWGRVHHGVVPIELDQNKETAALGMPETRCLVPRYPRLDFKASSDPPFKLSQFDILDFQVVRPTRTGSGEISGV